MKAAFLPVGVLLAAMFSGCVGEVSSQTAEGPKVSSGPAQFDDLTGAVEGTVTDTEVVPVAGAQVAILKSGEMTEDLVVLSDDFGRFSISLVPPGTHQLVAQKLGYSPTAKRITVEQGVVVQAQLALEKQAEIGPFVVRDVKKAAVTGAMVKLTPRCMYDLAGDGDSLKKTCQGVRTACDPSAHCEVHYNTMLEKNQEKGYNWTTIVGEVTWSAQTGATGKGFMWDLTAPNTPRGANGAINQGSPYTFYRMAPKPPLIWKIDEQLLTERKIPEKDWCCDWFYRLFPGNCDIGSQINDCEATPDIGIAQANVATVYMTFFFVEPATPTYTALPDR